LRLPWLENFANCPKLALVVIVLVAVGGDETIKWRDAEPAL
jgi:hypothetical protein